MRGHCQGKTYVHIAPPAASFSWRSSRPSRLTRFSFGVLVLLELSDRNNAVRKDSPDFQVSTHRSDKIGQRADVHVSSALDFGNGGLVYAQDFRKVLLGQETSRAQAEELPYNESCHHWQLRIVKH